MKKKTKKELKQSVIIIGSHDTFPGGITLVLLKGLFFSVHNSTRDKRLHVKNLRDVADCPVANQVKG